MMQALPFASPYTPHQDGGSLHANPRVVGRPSRGSRRAILPAAPPRHEWNPSHRPRSRRTV